MQCVVLSILVPRCSIGGRVMVLYKLGTSPLGKECNNQSKPQKKENNKKMQCVVLSILVPRCSIGGRVMVLYKLGTLPLGKECNNQSKPQKKRKQQKNAMCSPVDSG